MTQVDIDRALPIAIRHHQAGAWAEAEKIYRQILAQHPDHPFALHFLGIIAQQVGRSEMAADLIRRAIQKKPDYAEAYSSLGNALKDMGKLNEAVDCQLQSIRLKPTHGDAYVNLGNALIAQGKLDEALEAYRKAIQIKPDYAEAYNNLGNCLREQMKFDEAVAAFRQAIRFKPDYAIAFSNLGIALKDQKRLDEAVAAHREAIRIQPTYAEAYINLGNALRRQGKLEEAVAAHRQAIGLRPANADAHINFATALRDQGRLDESVIACADAIRLRPGYAEAHNNLGNALRDQGKLEHAIAAYRQAIAIRPDYADANWNLALALLLNGDFQSGWKQYEWRWKWKDFPSPARNFLQPRWDGGDLAGRTILLHAEQGFGDTIQFLRFAPLVAERGGKVILECSLSLCRLFNGFLGIEQIVPTGAPLPAFDLHCPLLSLPMVLDVRQETIPRNVPYLHAEPQLAEEWRGLFANASGRLKVGIVWAGSPAHTQDATRSLPPQNLAPLGQIDGVAFYSLQKEMTASPDLDLTNLGQRLTDFAQTAAAIAHLDLVVAVDTAVAHLAGAMGKPTWLLLPYSPDWRWLLHREDSPWYPTMRLFRQKNPGDWAGVIRRVAASLAAAPRPE